MHVAVTSPDLADVNGMRINACILMLYMEAACAEPRSQAQLLSNAHRIFSSVPRLTIMDRGLHR